MESTLQPMTSSIRCRANNIDLSRLELELLPLKMFLQKKKKKEEEGMLAPDLFMGGPAQQLGPWFLAPNSPLNAIIIKNI